LSIEGPKEKAEWTVECLFKNNIVVFFLIGKILLIHPPIEEVSGEWKITLL
jgi:hypothetical protein